MSEFFTIKQAAEATGLEESEIRYFEQVFREFLTFSRLAIDQNGFTMDHIEIMCRIRRLLRDEGRSFEEVRRLIKEAVNNKPKAANVQQIHSARRERLARVIAVTSGKGGVGKTFVTCNMAIAFALMGKRVAIFDADLGLANVHILMGVKPNFNMRNIIEDNFKLEDIVTTGPLGIKIVSGGQGVREMANLNAEHRRIVLRQIDQLERDVDILLVDTGAGISENVLRFATYADEIMVVTTPNIAASADGYSIIKILLEMEPNSKIGLIANQAQSMYHSKNVFNRINTATRKYLQYELGDLGYIVSDEHVERSCQARKPLMLEHGNCEAAKCIRAIADTVMNTDVFVNQRKGSGFEDLMGALKRTVVGA